MRLTFDLGHDGVFENKLFLRNRELITDEGISMEPCVCCLSIQDNAMMQLRC